MLGCRPGLMRFAWPGWIICAWFWLVWFVWFWFVWLGRLAWFWLVWFWLAWFWLAWFSLGGRVSYSSRICLTPARMLANDAASIFSAIVFEGGA